MHAIAPWLVAAGAAIAFVLGAAHLLYTFRGPKLLPRDPALQARMREVAPVITRQTTMWRGYIGFNASHGLGLVVFGAVYVDLALAEGGLLFRSAFLLALGLAALLVYAVLARRYFFSTPWRAIVVATALYAAGAAIGRP